MMDRIAVVLRGHIRTWNIIHQDVFDFYSTIAQNVDYYFITWSLPNFDFVPIKNTFKNQNLVDFVILPKVEQWYTSWYGPSIMTYILRPYIEQRLKSVQYDAIIETRPDVAIRFRENNTLSKPESNKLYVYNIEVHTSNNTKKPTIALTDYWFLSDYNVFKRMSERFIVEPIHGNQVDYRYYAAKENIGINTLCNCIETILTRPNCYSLAGQIREKFSELYDMHEQWHFLSSEAKIAMCYNNNINVADYMTTSITCKI